MTAPPYGPADTDDGRAIRDVDGLADRLRQAVAADTDVFLEGPWRVRTVLDLALAHPELLTRLRRLGIGYFDTPEDEAYEREREVDFQEALDCIPEAERAAEEEELRDYYFRDVPCDESWDAVMFAELLATLDRLCPTATLACHKCLSEEDADALVGEVGPRLACLDVEFLCFPRQPSRGGWDALRLYAGRRVRTVTMELDSAALSALEEAVESGFRANELCLVADEGHGFTDEEVARLLRALHLIALTKTALVGGEFERWPLLPSRSCDGLTLLRFPRCYAEFERALGITASFK